MQEIVDEIRATLDDEVLSRSERRELKQILKAIRDDQQRMWLRSEVFDMARERIEDPKALKIVDWLEDASKLLRPKANGENAGTRVYFSPGDDCLNAIKHQIQAARKTLKICVFTISDDRISKTISQAHQRGVSVKIITDNDKQYDKGSDIFKLQKQGLSIRFDRTDKHMHHKFAVIDEKTVITGSYNWTRSAEKYNEENVLLTENPAAVKAYLKEFSKLWDKFG